jgi:hypothetical protein
MMQHSVSVQVRGDVKKALDQLIAALTTIGFRLVAKSKTSLEFDGPEMNSTRQSPLVGASRIRVLADAHSLSLDAELGGVRRMVRFVWLFPPALCIGLFVALVSIFAVIFPPERLPMITGLVGAICGANLLFWLAAAPLMAMVIRNRSRRALDILVENAAMVARDIS